MRGIRINHCPMYTVKLNVLTILISPSPITSALDTSIMVIVISSPPRPSAISSTMTKEPLFKYCVSSDFGTYQLIENIVFGSISIKHGSFSDNSARLRSSAVSVLSLSPVCHLLNISIAICALLPVLFLTFFLKIASSTPNCNALNSE